MSKFYINIKTTLSYWRNIGSQQKFDHFGDKLLSRNLNFFSVPKKVPK